MGQSISKQSLRLDRTFNVQVFIAKMPFPCSRSKELDLEATADSDTAFSYSQSQEQPNMSRLGNMGEPFFSEYDSEDWLELGRETMEALHDFLRTGNYHDTNGIMKECWAKLTRKMFTDNDKMNGQRVMDKIIRIYRDLFDLEKRPGFSLVSEHLVCFGNRANNYIVYAQDEAWDQLENVSRFGSELLN